MATLVSICYFLFFIVSFRSVTGDIAVQSALKDVRECLGKNLEPCLADRAIRSLLKVTQLSDILSQPSNDGRSEEVPIEDLLVRRLARESGISEKVLNSVPTGRSRTFNKAWKYIVPFLIGVMLKLAAFIPLVFAVLTIIAKNALLTGNLALLITGLNIALKYWYPKWTVHSYSSGFDHLSHMGFDNHGQFNGFHQGYNYQQPINHHPFNQYNQHGHQQEESSQEQQNPYGNPQDGHYKTKRVFLVPQ